MTEEKVIYLEHSIFVLEIARFDVNTVGPLNTKVKENIYQKDLSVVIMENGKLILLVK